MKIFNWVHRRFAQKEGLGESVKKKCVIDGEINNADKVFDDWTKGILTVGTLEYEALKYETMEKNHESENEIIADSEEESKPLIHEIITESEASHVKEEIDLELEFDAMIMNIPKKESSTLAELFHADHSEKKRKPSRKLGEMMKMMEEEDKSSSKNGSSLGKKDARPIHKLHRLMRMMLKRKIHPYGGNKRERESSSNETASLLPAHAHVGVEDASN